tara:strand:+ start:7112 stop:7354 length:243 start_codon:yes stop_codon:yes gene_type:complete
MEKTTQSAPSKTCPCRFDNGSPFSGPFIEGMITNVFASQLTERLDTPSHNWISWEIAQMLNGKVAGLMLDDGYEVSDVHV